MFGSARQAASPQLVGNSLIASEIGSECVPVKLWVTSMTSRAGLPSMALDLAKPACWYSVRSSSGTNVHHSRAFNWLIAALQTLSTHSFRVYCPTYMRQVSGVLDQL